MGSVKYRKPQDRIVLGCIRKTFHDLMEELEGSEALSIGDQKLRIAIIEELIDLASDGTPQEAWKAEVLRRLPLR